MLHWLISTAEVVGLMLCVVGATLGGFQVATFVGLVVLGASLVAGVQVASLLLAPAPVVVPEPTPAEGAW